MKKQELTDSNGYIGMAIYYFDSGVVIVISHSGSININHPQLIEIGAAEINKCIAECFADINSNSK